MKQAHRTRAQHNNNHKFHTYTSAVDLNSMNRDSDANICCVVLRFRCESHYVRFRLCAFGLEFTFALSLSLFLTIFLSFSVSPLILYAGILSLNAYATIRFSIYTSEYVVLSVASFHQLLYWNWEIDKNEQKKRKREKKEHLKCAHFSRAISLSFFRTHRHFQHFKAHTFLLYEIALMGFLLTGAFEMLQFIRYT